MTMMKPARRPRIEEQKPVQIAKALRVYGETGDLQQTADTAGCHVSTIRRLLARDMDGFAQVKRTIAAKSFELSAAAQEVALERVGELNAYQAAIASKIASQQGQELLAGQPGVTINVALLQSTKDEIDQLTVSRDELARAIERIRAEQAQPCNDKEGVDAGAG